MTKQLLKNTIKDNRFHQWLDEVYCPLLLFWNGNLYLMHKHHSYLRFDSAKIILVMKGVRPPNCQYTINSGKYPNGKFIYIYD